MDALLQSKMLNNGVAMPQLGLGVWESKEGTEVINAVTFALNAGYRSIDTAAIYRNERGVGIAISDSNVPREEIFLTSKVWNSDQGFESTLKAFNNSLDRLQMDYLDLYLMHWPVRRKYKETWKALEKLYEEGKIRTIGVSNFLVHHLKDLLSEADVVPAVNQVEFHPYLIQQDLQDYCKEKGIVVEAWSPLMKARFIQVELFNEIGKKYGKTSAQVVLRWHIQRGVVVIPKSVRESRIIENADIFDFDLTDSEMNQINTLDRNHRFGPDPDNFNF